MAAGRWRFGVLRRRAPEVPGKYRNALRPATCLLKSIRPRFHFSSGRAGIAATMRYAFELSREGFKRRLLADAMPERQHTSP